MKSNSTPWGATLSGEKHSWVMGVTDEGRPYLDPTRVEIARKTRSFLLGPREPRVDLPPRDMSVAIMPGISTSSGGLPDEGYLRFLNDLRIQVLKLGTADIDRGLMTSSGIVGDLTQLLTLAGFPMKPTPAPDPFNGYRVVAKAFKNERHRLIARELADCMLGSWNPLKGYRIARVSTMGFPDFNFKIDRKLTVASNVMRQAASVCALYDKGDLEGLWTRHDIVTAYYATYRLQADSSPKNEDTGLFEPKTRASYGLRWATTAMMDPPMADKTINSKYPAFRQRVRLAYGLPGRINYMIGGLMSGFRDSYLEKYAATWVTKGPEDLQESIQGWHIMGVDVKQFDSTYPEFLLAFFLDEIARRFPAMRSLLQATQFAPTFTARRGPSEPAFWTGDPLDPTTFGCSLGLPSGVAYNPDAGKFGGTLQALLLIDDLIGDVLGNVDVILKGQHPEVGLKNSADDMLFKFKDPDKARALHEQLGDPKHPSHEDEYFALAPEDYVTYLGNAIYVEQGTTYRVEPSINSVLVNWFVPERAAGSAFRPYPGTGWFAREQHFAKSRMYEQVAEIRDRTVRHYYGVDPNDMMRPIAQAEASRLGSLNAADMRLMEKPERLFYTTDADEGQFMADTLSAVVPPGFIIDCLQSLYQPSI